MFNYAWPQYQNASDAPNIGFIIVKVPSFEPNLLSNLSQFNDVNFYLFVSWCGLVVNNI